MNAPNVRRQVREVTLPGGSLVHVRKLTLAELRKVDAAAESEPEGSARAIRTVQLLASFGWCHPDGAALFEDPTGAAALDRVAEQLDPDQLKDLTDAAAGGSVAAAGKG